MHAIVIRIDRVQIASWAPTGWRPPNLPGFEVTGDTFVRKQTNIVTYSRCRRYQSTKNSAKIYWQYYPQKGWLAHWKITLVADDKAGLSFDEIALVWERCRYHRFLTIEVAIDFGLSTGVDKDFVRRHAIFGKSQRRNSAKQGDALYFGSRKSGKFVRCYQKPEVKAYRVELELHAQFLHKTDINRLDEFDALAIEIHPRHFQLVDLDWRRLKRYLRRKRHSRVLIAGAQQRAASLSRLRRYLWRHDIKNFHRFLVPLAINRKIKRAFTKWMLDFEHK
jgi:hypothetical protein